MLSTYLAGRVRIVAVDPGLRVAGVSVFRNDYSNFTGARLATSKVVEVPGRVRGPVAWIKMAEKVADLVCIGIVDVLVLEWMELYGLRGQKGSQEDVGELLGVAGAIAGVIRPSEVIGYKPKTWKGQTPKAIHNKRVLAALSPEERKLVPRDHNAVDSVGLGLYYLERLRP